MKNLIKGFFVLVIFLLIGGGYYLYKLHALAVEGNIIFALRCTKVNLPLIAYKKAFLNLVDTVKNPTKYKEGEAKKFFSDYVDNMRKYIPEETDWLERNEKYIHRWDFQLIEPWYLKQAGEYQQKMYEGYRDDAKYMLEVYDSGNTNEELSAKFSDARSRRDKYSQLYFGLFDEVATINDWRKIFGNVPVPKECTDDVLIIPNTSGALEPSPAPIEYYLSG